MSRIGYNPINLPSGVTLSTTNGVVNIKGPKGELTVSLPSTLELQVEGETATLTRQSEEAKAMHGTVRALLANAVTGVSTGWSKTLEIIGSGYRANASGQDLELAMGYSHPVKLTAPTGVEVTVAKNTVTISGIDRQAVGQFAAIVRAVRKPEPYKGKGIRYSGEHVRRKAGKALKSGS